MTLGYTASADLGLPDLQNVRHTLPSVSHLTSRMCEVSCLARLQSHPVSGIVTATWEDLDNRVTALRKAQAFKRGSERPSFAKLKIRLIYCVIRKGLILSLVPGKKLLKP